MSDFDSDSCPPFKNFCDDKTLDDNLSSFTSCISIFHQRQLSEVLELRRFKRYAVTAIARHGRICDQVPRMKNDISDLQKFQDLVKAHFKSAEDKISDLEARRDVGPSDIGGDNGDEKHLADGENNDEIARTDADDDVAPNSDGAGVGNQGAGLPTSSGNQGAGAPTSSVSNHSSADGNLSPKVTMSSLVRKLFQKGAITVNDSDADDVTKDEANMLLNRVHGRLQSPLAQRMTIGKRARRIRNTGLPSVDTPVTAERPTPRTAAREVLDNAEHKHKEAEYFALTFPETLTQPPVLLQWNEFDRIYLGNNVSRPFIDKYGFIFVE